MTKAEFQSLGRGAFTHYLNGLQNGADYHNTRGEITSWDECVRELDTEKLAEQLEKGGAKYLFFTMQQGTRHFIAPNRAADELMGTKPGEACASRDLVLDLYESLRKRGLKLFLYFTGDGLPRDEDPEKRKISITGERKASEPFVRAWAGILREYSLRYGDKVCGWWLDGAYGAIGYDKPLLDILFDAARAGNPDALVSANYYGCFEGPGRELSLGDYGNTILANFYQRIAPAIPQDDYTAGELVHFNAYPVPQERGEAVPHALSFLGITQPMCAVYNGWCARGTKYSDEYIREYVRAFNALGGVVTIDMCLYRDGTLDPIQLAQIARID